MSKASGPVDEVKQWPLILCFVLLAIAAGLNRRLGNDGAAIALGVVAVVIPMLGFGLRSWVGGPAQPRVRRVYVDESPTPTRAVKLDSAHYMTPPPTKGLSEDAIWLESLPIPAPMVVVIGEDDDETDFECS
jgi:hypothetical protein